MLGEQKRSKKNSRICHQEGDDSFSSIFIQLLKTILILFYPDSNGRSLRTVEEMAPGLLNPCTTILDRQI